MKVFIERVKELVSNMDGKNISIDGKVILSAVDKKSYYVLKVKN